jgi:hypothetical protein
LATEVTTIDASSAGGAGGSGSGREVSVERLSSFLREPATASVIEASLMSPGGDSSGRIAAATVAPADAAAEVPAAGGSAAGSSLAVVPSTRDVNSSASATLIEPPAPVNYQFQSRAERDSDSDEEDEGISRRLAPPVAAGGRRHRMRIPAAAGSRTFHAPAPVASAADRLGGKLVALVRRLRALPPGERAVVATSWPALRQVIGHALIEQVRGWRGR